MSGELLPAKTDLGGHAELVAKEARNDFFGFVSLLLIHFLRFGYPARVVSGL